MLKIIDRNLFKPELDYMTNMEMKAFEELVNSVGITVFKISKCETCGRDIINSKKYCSKECSTIEDDESDEEDIFDE